MGPTHIRVWRSGLGLLAAGATVVLAACGGGGGGNGGGGGITASSYKPTAGTQGGQLVYSDWESVQDLNVMSSSAQTTTQVTGVIWAGLWEPDATNNFLPDLVSEIPTTQNGDVKTIDSTHMDITIKLKKGLNWSDGQPLTTKDVQFTWQAICDPNTGVASQLGWDHIVSMDIKDDQTMVWHFGPDPAGTRCGLSAPLTTGIFAPYLSAFSTPSANGPMPMHILQGVQHKDWATNSYFTTKPTATSGPYMVQDFTPGSAAQVVLVPNPHYADGRGSSDPFFGHKPYLDKLIYKIYGDKSSQIAGLKAGDTDLGMDLIAKDLPSLQAITQMKTIYETGLLDEGLYYNQGNNRTGCAGQQFAPTCGTPTPWKGDLPVLQALNLAIDKDAINQQLVGGIGKPMNSLFVSTLAPYYNTSTPAFQRDVAKANSLLDGDGWTKGSDGIRAKNGKKLQFVISTTSGNQQRASEEELLITNWKDIGASVTTKNFPAGDFFNDFKGGGTNATGQFDVSLYANSWAPDPSSWCTAIETSQIPTATNPSGSNWIFLSDPKVDSGCSQGDSTVDVNKRVTIYKGVEDQLRADGMPYNPLYERPDVYTMAPYWGNFMPAVNTCVAVCNAADWYRGKS